MKGQLRQINKKGVSIMVGYVLLVVIAVSISVLVYNFLKVYVPKEKPECSKEVSLIIQEAECIISSGKSYFSLTVLNKGLFNIDAMYIRLGNETRKVRQLVNDETKNSSYSVYLPKGYLLPGQEFRSPLYYDVTWITNNKEGEYILEVQPGIFSEGELAICEQYVTIKKVTCLAS
ncbi:hypothetical protein J4408_03495 [Candidatus Pacearchaeota archaeon]|nr:hypothetical protein [Candidatus Pacearchaeota archaeon]